MVSIIVMTWLLFFSLRRKLTLLLLLRVRTLILQFFGPKSGYVDCFIVSEPYTYLYSRVHFEEHSSNVLESFMFYVSALTQNVVISYRSLHCQDGLLGMCQVFHSVSIPWPGSSRFFQLVQWASVIKCSFELLQVLDTNSSRVVVME